MKGYCVACRAKRDIRDQRVRATPAGQPFALGTCARCGQRVATFVSRGRRSRTRRS